LKKSRRRQPGVAFELKTGSPNIAHKNNFPSPPLFPTFLKNRTVKILDCHDLRQSCVPKTGCRNNIQNKKLEK